MAGLVRAYVLNAFALVLTIVSTGTAVNLDYGMYSGLNDEDYQKAKYMQFGWRDAFNQLGLSQHKYIGSVPWQWYENSFVPSYRSYEIPQFDSARADYSALTVYVGHSGTFQDARTKDFFFLMETRNSWNEVSYFTSDMVRLGESLGYLPDDDYPGYCRYVLALGCNAVAMGPAVFDGEHATYSRPDLFNPDHPDHANPFLIWGPVMTDGVRLVLGHTDYTYFSGSTDQDKYRRFADLLGGDCSIAEAFARTSREAFDAQKPVVIAQGATLQECESIIEDEDAFSNDRPLGNAVRLLYCWYEDRVLEHSDSSKTRKVAANSHAVARSDKSISEISALPDTLALYTSEDSDEVQTETLRKYMHLLGVDKFDAVHGDAKTRKTLCKVDEDRKVVIDSRRGSLYYRDTKAARTYKGTCQLSKSECIDQALQLLVKNDIVAPEELCVNKTIAVSRWAATANEVASNVYTSSPEIVRYIVVLKRKLGALPILSNDADTITVEIGATGDLVSLTSEYAYGRTVTAQHAVAPIFRTVDEAKSGLPSVGAIRDLRTGLLADEDGGYLPVYEVITMANSSGLTPRPDVTYYRVDTLEEVTQDLESEGYELEEDLLQN